MKPESLKIGRDRLTRVFQFLQALNQHRNPATRQIRDQLWHFWLRDLPDHPSIRRGQVFSPQDNKNLTAAETATDGREPNAFVLKVGRPKLAKAPEPSEVVRYWLAAGWDDPVKECIHVESRNEENDERQTVLVQFGDDQNIAQAFQDWKSIRDEWARNEQPARKAMKIFEALYGLYGRIEREAERVELVIGDGILSWRRPEGGIRHPILLQRLQLEFDPSVPEFTLIETETPVELYTSLFQSVSEVDGRAIARCREELEQGEYSPLDGDATSGYLRRLVVQLSAKGEFVESPRPEVEKDDPRISRDQVVFLRSRTLGFAAAIEGILEDLRLREDLPWPLLNIVGVETMPADEASPETQPAASWEEPANVLLSKPANPEQITIAQRIDRHGGILVQGPPGTGKTHTIGNLIGHLLAHGKSVLVTSHTTKAPHGATARRPRATPVVRERARK